MRLFFSDKMMKAMLVDQNGFGNKLKQNGKRMMGHN